MRLRHTNTDKAAGARRGRGALAQWRIRVWAVSVLVLAAGYVQWQAGRLAVPSLLLRPAASAAPRVDVARYHVAVEAQAIAGIHDNLSGLTYNHDSGTLFGVTNRPPAVVELSTTGVLLRQMPITGAKDPEGIAHIEDDWFAIADERRNRIHWVQIAPDQRQVALQRSTSLALGDAAIKNFGVEGLGWDARRRQLLAVTEKWPLRVLAIDSPTLEPGSRLVHTGVHAWDSSDASGLPTTDLASVEVDPRTGNLLLLGEESSVLYEYTRSGQPLGALPLWGNMAGLDHTIAQPEGVAIDGAGTLYIVAEPNLFYRFEKRS